MNYLYGEYIKRCLAIIISLILLLILSPLLIIISLLIFINLGNPVFFTQYRPGKNGEIFKLIKFRTMNNKKDENGLLLPDNERLTKFGLFLRKTSIDELPELINIIKGDMAFIGPRPLSIHYLPSFDDNEKVRNLVRPGLTGLAQIKGRNSASWEDRMKHDCFYVSNLTLLLDIKIFFLSIWKVVRQSDVGIRKKNEEIKNFNVYKIVKEQKMNLGVSEIGSYFEFNDIQENTDCSLYDYIIRNKKEYAFTISGRSSIELAIVNLKLKADIKRVYLPSYSCVSMTQPFLDNHIEVFYYEVFLDEFNQLSFNVDVDKIQENDIFLFMDYFGFTRLEEGMKQIMKKLTEKDVFIIQDATHSIFSEQSVLEYIDYQVCSIRKWCSVPSGGFISSNKHELEILPIGNTNDVVIRKIEGMKMKSAYLSGQKIEKKDFLIRNAEFDNSLIRLDYTNKIDDISLQILKNTSYENIRQKRKDNGRYLLENIVENKNVKLIYNDIKDNEVPLFIPITINEEHRDRVRKACISEGIYLPVHWPEKLNKFNVICDVELSIICDQRYDISDMEKIVEILNDNLK